MTLISHPGFHFLERKLQEANIFIPVGMSENSKLNSLLKFLAESRFELIHIVLFFFFSYVTSIGIDTLPSRSMKAVHFFYRLHDVFLLSL